MIYVIDDDEIMRECVARACGKDAEVLKFSNAYDAIQAIDDNLPDLVFLDLLLIGVDGFTFLNELMSYPDTAETPVVVVTSLDMRGMDLSAYGVVEVLDKAKMVPEEILEYVKKYCAK